MDQRTSPATLKQRLWDFFGAHLLLNFCALLPLGLFYYFSRMVYEPGFLQCLLSLPCLLALVAYFPLGAWRAKKKQWGAASLGCNALTILLPAMGFSLLSRLVLALPVLSTVVFLWLLFAFFAPQTAFILTVGHLLINAPASGPNVSFSPLFYLAALLPPLLFTLGSYWQSKRQAPPQP